jgi:hypothetical protein
VAAEEAPEGGAGALRLQVPERHVDRRDREHGRAAAPAVVQRPPQLLPQALDEVGVLAGQDLGHLAGEDVVDGAAVAADGEGVADAFRTISVAHADRAELEGAHLAVGAVGEHRRQGHPVEAGLEVRDRGHGARDLTVSRLCRMTTRSRNAPRITDCQ